MLAQTQSEMLSSSSLKLSAYKLPINNFAYAIEHTTYSNPRASLVKSICPCFGLGLFSSFKGPYSFRAMHNDIYSKGVKSDQLGEPNFNEKTLLESVDFEDDDEEIEKKAKIGHRNKGRVPWNKGLKHSQETRERIRIRTKEALKDPKVRKKMSEAPRSLSNQTKSRIRASLTMLWEKRLKWKRSREKFFQSWAESIAEAAKIGGIDQQELDWDSYEKLKQEIALIQIRQTAEKAKAKEMKRVRAERATEVKAEKMARLAQKRREREESVKSRGESTRKRNKKSKEEKERLAEFEEEKLKERLMKIHKKKSAINQVSNQHQRGTWEKFDLDFSKGLRKETSLADQIRFAKNRRSEQML